MACLLTACFTEVGNPGKEQKVTADFSIDYTANPPPPLAKSGIQATISSSQDSVHILQFYLNVVVITYRTVQKTNGTLWSATDSVGIPVDFTQEDSTAVLPPLDVPATAWEQVKFKSRIPDHAALNPDTIDFNSFADREYIKGTLGAGAGQIRFLIELPNIYRLNMIYDQNQLSLWQVGNAYHLQFKFYPTPWVLGNSIDTAAKFSDQTGTPVTLIDLEHNLDLYQRLVTAFFKAFNANSVQTENP